MVLEVNGIEKSFGNQMVLQDVSFAVEKGEITTVIGHSGAGKTTLLRCINGLERCDRGSILVEGKFLCKQEDEKMRYASGADMKDIRKKLGFVFQNYNLFPHKSVLHNIIEAPVNVYKMPQDEASEKAYELLELLNIKEKANCYPYQLSGGQKQRVAIARACALTPSILCFDEPTSALDPELKESIACIIERLSEKNKAILIITHDISFAKRVADKVIYMEAGRILHGGSAKDFFANPKDEKIKRFICA